jgi:hypothetical protein
MQDKKPNMLLNPRYLQVLEDKMTEGSERLPRPLHFTIGGVRLAAGLMPTVREGACGGAHPNCAGAHTAQVCDVISGLARISTTALYIY